MPPYPLQLRAGRAEKSRKDLKQAAVLIAATAELFPGAIEEAARAAKPQG